MVQRLMKVSSSVFTYFFLPFSILFQAILCTGGLVLALNTGVLQHPLHAIIPVVLPIFIAVCIYLSLIKLVCGRKRILHRGYRLDYLLFSLVPLALLLVVTGNIFFYRVCMTSAGFMELLIWFFLTTTFLSILIASSGPGNSTSLTKRIALLTSLMSLLFLFQTGKASLYTRLPEGTMTPQLAALSETSDPERRFIIIGIDALQYELVTGLADTGYLPNFNKQLQYSVAGRLRTHVPTSSPIIWTTIATGMLPVFHGIRDFVTYRHVSNDAGLDLLPRYLMLGSLLKHCNVHPLPVSSRDRREFTFWEILGKNWGTVGIVNWWATIPVDPVNGFFIGNLLYGSKNPEVEKILAAPQNIMYPADGSMDSAFREAFEHARNDFPLAAAKVLESFSGKSTLSDAERYRRMLIEDVALQPDLITAHLGRILNERYKPRLFAIYLNGLDITKHLCLKGQVDEQTISFIVENETLVIPLTIVRYYQFLDSLIGLLTENRDPQQTVIILSDHGMEPIPLLRRLHYKYVRKIPHLQGYHDKAPAGCYILNGEGIVAGVRSEPATVYDMTPTILHLAGLPVSSRMTGQPLKAVFTEAWWEAHPVRLIDDYGFRRSHAVEIPMSLPQQSEMLHLLRSLGYLD